MTRFVDGTVKVLSTNDGLPGSRISGLARSADGVPLVYTRSGLARWTHDRFVPVEDVAGIPWDRVNALLEDRFGTLWLAIHEGGLIHVRDGQATHLAAKDGLPDDTVLTLFEDRQGSLWVGTLRNGVMRISEGQMTSWSTRDGLAANHVKAFYQDSAGTLWIGTHGGGLSRFKDGRFASISARQGLYNDDIFQILEDDDANLWMNCNTGIWRTSLRQLNEVADGSRTAVESFAYGTADGMLSSEGVGGFLAGWKMHDGSLWFPTTKGIVAIDPRRRDTEPPRVLIERITIDGEPTAIGGPLRLTPGQENLEIQYTGLSWSRPQAIKFRFRLIGLDRDWVEAGPRRTAYYSHLPPGSYTFNVTADNGEGVWNAAGQTLAIVVLPRFYQTWWLRAAAASSLVALVWLAWRYRIAQMRRAQAAQQAFSRQLIESQEHERKRIAAELHDSLGQNLLVVKNRALLVALSQQDAEVRRQFNELGATVALTLEEVRTISYNLRPHHLDQLGLTTAIRAMLDKIAESSTIAMSSEFDDIDSVVPPADEITIYRIIQESLNNVVKHSRASEAHVAVHCHEHHLEITIRDNGQGFALGAAKAGSANGGGFGLKGLAERVHMLGGTHTIESSPGRGTTLTVRLARRSPGAGGMMWARVAGSAGLGNEIRVLIADDHPIFRQGLRQIIEAQRELIVVAEAADGGQALERLQKGDVTVAVLDVTMPVKDGFAVAREVRERRLAAALVFLTMHKDEHYLNAALDLGVRGYVLKDNATTEIVDCVRSVGGGASTSAPRCRRFSFGAARAPRIWRIRNPRSSNSPPQSGVF